MLSFPHCFCESLARHLRILSLRSVWLLFIVIDWLQRERSVWSTRAYLSSWFWRASLGDHYHNQPHLHCQHQQWYHHNITLIIFSSDALLLIFYKDRFFWFLKDSARGGGADLPLPSKNGVTGWVVPKLSWSLMFYQDWCQTKGFMTFRYQEPPQLIVWRSDFSTGYMRFMRVPPYESWVNWTNFYFSCENGDRLLSQKSCNLFHTKIEEKSQKISTRIRIRKYVTGGGAHCAPPRPP